MATIYDVGSSELLEKTAEELKKIDIIIPPKWAPFVKTGMHKARPPIRADWWYLRTASVLRKVYILGPIGVSKLRRLYGGRKDRGYKTEHFYRASGNIIRKILQQLQKAELIKYVEKGVHKGRCIAPKGISLLDNLSNEIYTRSKQSQAKPADATVSEKSPRQDKPIKKSPPKKPAKSQAISSQSLPKENG